MNREPVSRHFLGLFLAVSSLAACKGVQGDSEALLSKAEMVHGLDSFGPVPGNLERFVQCPVSNKSAHGNLFGQQRTYKKFDEVAYSEPGWVDNLAADWDALDGVVPQDLDAVVIDIRRVDNKPAYFYLANQRNHLKLYEPWSSAKFMVVSAAIAKARALSGGRVGANAKIGRFDIGDMITRIHTYKPVFDDSNGMSNYFLNAVGIERFNDLLHDSWLHLPDGSAMNSGFGKANFSSTSYDWIASTNKVSLPPNKVHWDNKRLSLLGQSEWLKRLTQHMSDSNRLPGFQSEDLRILFYGNQSGKMGGMLAGSSVYVAEALMGGKPVGSFDGNVAPENAAAKAHLDRMTGGKWRIFHKLGAGASDSRHRSEIIMTTYACLPGFDGGHEFIIATRTHAGSLKSADKATTKAFNAIVSKLVPGFAPK